MKNLTVYISLMLCLLACVCSCAGKHDRMPSSGQVERINAQRAQAVRLIDQEDFSGALEILTAVNDRMPGDAWTLSMLAWTQWKTGLVSEAVENFEASLRRSYTDYLTHLRFATMLFERGKIGRALTEFELAVRYGEGEALPHYNYGLTLFKLGRKQEALTEWQRAYDLNRSDPRFAEALGMGLTGTDDQRAFAFFEEAQALGMDTASFHYNFALLLERLGRYGRAEREYKRAVRKAPQSDSYRFGLAALYTKRGDYEKALPIWEVLTERSPTDLSYRIHLARVYLELGFFKDAVSTLETFEKHATEGKVALNGINAGGDQLKSTSIDEAFNILAMSYRGNENLERANFFIEKALEINPESVTFLNNYGVILAERGMMKLAKIQWQKVLAIDPENEVARQNLSALDQ